MAVVHTGPKSFMRPRFFRCHYCPASFDAWWMFYEHESNHPEYRLAALDTERKAE